MPERKPACGRWAGTRALRARKKTGLRPMGMYTGPLRLKGNRPAPGGQVHGASRPKENRHAAGGHVHGQGSKLRKKLGARVHPGKKKLGAQPKS